MRGNTLSGCAVVVAAASGGLACVHSPGVASPDLTEVRSGALDADDLRRTPARQLEELLEGRVAGVQVVRSPDGGDRKSTRLNSSHSQISYAVFCLKKKKKHITYL